MGGLPNENEEIKIFFLMGGERGKGADKDSFPHGWGTGWKGAKNKF